MTDLFSGDTEPGHAPSRRERRQDRRRKAERRKNTISFLVMVGALVLLVGGAWFFVKPLFGGLGASEPNDFPGPGSGATEIVIGDGDTGAKIGSTLVDAGVVRTVQAFTQAFDANPNAQKIQAGTYSLPTEMRAVDAVAALLDSSYRVDLRITIPEGWAASQVYDRIADLMDTPLEEVQEAAERVGERLPAAAEGNLEGWLAPSTYTLAPGESAEDALNQMVERTENTLRDLDAPADEQQEILIKASIVEKEDREQYRAQIARVIENRLAGCSGDGSLGMDSTLVYAFGKPYSQITKEERDSSAYNTRDNPGLPPTPIGAPSTHSIEAVLNPADGDWCYFVTINLETGETLFTDDFAEHKANQELYREYLKEIREESDDGEG